jgi:release factor glutamine methyltransferase
VTGSEVKGSEVTDTSGARVDDLLRVARQQLAATHFAGQAPARREAALLLGRLLGWNEAQVLARGDRAVAPATAERFRRLLARRLTGEPVAYLLGEREFYGRPFRVDRRVLIPRPETEHLVAAALDCARRLRPAARPGTGGGLRLLDVGTGSGCLAITLALELPAARVVATDVSPAALALAAVNARALGAADRVRFVASDLEMALGRAARFELIVSNPPYVAEQAAPLLSPEVTGFEPTQALFAPDDGLAVLLRLARAATARLAEGGFLLCEIGDGQLPALTGRLAQVAPGLQVAGTVEDYAGKPRVVILQDRPASPSTIQT